MQRDDDRSAGLLAWQLEGYPRNHTDRRNLIIHVVTVPIFWAGTVALLASPLAWWLAPAGLVAAVLAIALQGRGHRLEPQAPIPFRGPGDAIARLLVEQWITFPRFVLGGGLARALRARDRA